MLCSPDGDIEFVGIVAGDLQEATLSRNYVLQLSINLMNENGFKLKPASSRRYPADMTDSD